MISNDSRHENNSQLELADGAKCSKRFISKVTSIFRRKFDLVMPLSRIFYFPDNVFFLPETVASRVQS